MTKTQNAHIFPDFTRLFLELKPVHLYLVVGYPPYISAHMDQSCQICATTCSNSRLQENHQFIQRNVHNIAHVTHGQVEASGVQYQVHSHGTNNYDQPSLKQSTQQKFVL